MTQQFSDLQIRQQRKDRHKLCWLFVLLIVVSCLSLSLGEIVIWPHRWLSTDAGLFVWQLRFPRSLAVIGVGAGLAVAGAVMQALFDNPLSEPGLLGVANGAGVALVMSLLLSGGMLPIWALSLSAITGALFLTLLLLIFSQLRQLSGARLLLVGVALSIICSAMMTWAVYYSSSLDLRQLMYWLMGSFSGIDWRQKWLVFALIPAIFWLAIQGRTMDLLALGESQARQLGVSIQVWRNLLVIAVAWIVGISVALAGVISFIGLIVPHILRLSGMTSHRYLLVGCALTGASVLLLADLVARIALQAAELPIGVVTATFGAPLFIWMLSRYVRV